MNYEEKLKEAKKLYESANDDQKYILESLFPELKESENELEWLTQFIQEEVYSLSMDIRDDEDRIKLKKLQRSLEWLKKQGENNKWKPSKDEMDALYSLSYLTNKVDDEKDEAITKLYQDLKREFFGGKSYENMFPTNTSTEDDVRRRSTIQVLEYARNLDTYNQYGKEDITKNIAWLEKQEGCEHIRKDWLEHIKQSWYKEGFIYGKYSGETSKEWTISDAATLKELIDFLENGTAKLQHDLTRYANWLKIQFTPIEKKSEQKSTWSGEDDYNVQCLIAKTNCDIQKGNVGRNEELIDWLKSLKNRIKNGSH